MQNIHISEDSISPIQLASALGVSESTIKRWVDKGRISASRTAGGHRRIHLQDALRFVRDSQMRLKSPELLIPSLKHDYLSPTPLSISLDSALIQGDLEKVQGILVGSFLSRHSLAQIWDELVQPAMERIGQLWHHGDEGILMEHRAIDICLQVLYQIRSLLPTVAEGEPKAIGAALEQDPYMLPSLAASMVLTDSGWSTTNFGPRTPVQTLGQAIEVERPSLVWVSISNAVPEEKLRGWLDYLAETAHQLGACLVAGGRAFPKGLDLPRPNFYRGSNMGDLRCFAAGIRASTQLRGASLGSRN